MKARLAKKIARELMEYKNASKATRLRHSVPQQYKAMHVYARTHEVWRLEDCEYYNKESKDACKRKEREDKLLIALAKKLSRLSYELNARKTW